MKSEGVVLDDLFVCLTRVLQVCDVEVGGAVASVLEKVFLLVLESKVFPVGD